MDTKMYAFGRPKDFHKMLDSVLDFLSFGYNALITVDDVLAHHT